MPRAPDLRVGRKGLLFALPATPLCQPPRWPPAAFWFAKSDASKQCCDRRCHRSWLGSGLEPCAAARATDAAAPGSRAPALNGRVAHMPTPPRHRSIEDRTVGDDSNDPPRAAAVTERIDLRPARPSLWQELRGIVAFICAAGIRCGTVPLFSR